MGVAALRNPAPFPGTSESPTAVRNSVLDLQLFNNRRRCFCCCFFPPPFDAVCQAQSSTPRSPPQEPTRQLDSPPAALPPARPAFLGRRGKVSSSAAGEAWAGGGGQRSGACQQQAPTRTLWATHELSGARLASDFGYLWQALLLLDPIGSQQRTTICQGGERISSIDPRLSGRKAKKYRGCARAK